MGRSTAHTPPCLGQSSGPRRAGGPEALRHAGIRLCPALLLLALATGVRAQSDWVDRIMAAYRHQAPIETGTALDPDEAARIQHRVVSRLSADLGSVFGYKAGLTSPEAQERFNVDEPILGTLLSGMILDNGSQVSVAAGVHLLIEADLLVRVAGRRINNAATSAEAFDAIDRAAAFVEIPDVIIEAGQPVAGPVLTAVNSGARFGVMGPGIGTDELEMADLAGFTVRLLRNGEAAGAAGSGRALMGHPLNVVLWMVEAAQRRGINLEAGDWLSLGSLTAPVKARAGDQYRALYEGLGAGSLEVRVEFVP